MHSQGFDPEMTAALEADAAMIHALGGDPGPTIDDFPMAADNETPRTGVELIAAERQRQIAVEGWTAAHDDESATQGQYEQPALPQAAAIYAVTSHMGENAFLGCQNPGWPRDMKWFKPASPIRMLVKAGALIAAEIDRRLRAGEQP